MAAKAIIAKIVSESATVLTILSTKGELVDIPQNVVDTKISIVGDPDGKSRITLFSTSEKDKYMIKPTPNAGTSQPCTKQVEIDSGGKRITAKIFFDTIL